MVCITPCYRVLPSCVQRNYRTFLLFIYTTTVYIAWTFGVSLGSLFVKHAELEAAAAQPAQDNSDSMSSNLWLRTLSECRAAVAGSPGPVVAWLVVGVYRG